MSYKLQSQRGRHRRSYSPQKRRRTNRGRNTKQYINPDKFVRKASNIEAAAYVPQHSFENFAIHPLLQENIAKKGYVSPSQIQDQAIKPGLAGKDVIGIANTGTGKTAAFALPVLSKLLADPSARALIIAPTRELAQQIDNECRDFAGGSQLYGAILIGGANMGRQMRDLRNNPNIVIGTPGRIKDHLQRNTLKLHNFNIVVLDEVDRMLDMGFIPDITEILSKLAPTRQSLFFSATLDLKVARLIQNFSTDPITISVKVGEIVDSVDQDIVKYSHSSEKIDKLHDILNTEKVTKTLLFDDTHRSVEKISKDLVSRGFRADAIHGGKSQGQRQRALRKFRNNEIDILVATDVAARGIDITDITHVINYSQPNSYDDYIHRIGRAGRAGRSGCALTFVNS